MSWMGPVVLVKERRGQNQEGTWMAQVEGRWLVDGILYLSEK